MDVPELVPMEEYDSQKASIQSSLQWLLTKAYGNKIPTAWQPPCHDDQHGGVTVEETLMDGLASAEVYCKACANIFKSDQVQWKGHDIIIESLSRRGLYVVDPSESAVTKQILQQRSPFKLSAHMALIGSLMTAYSNEVVTIERVVQAVRRFISFNASSELPYDTEDSLLFWINKVCTTVQHQLNRGRPPDTKRRAPVVPVMDDLLKDISDGCCLAVLISFYCPNKLRLDDIALQDDLGIADSLYNLQLVCEFCTEVLPVPCLTLTMNDLFYGRDRLKPPLIAFLADLFYYFEVEKAPYVRDVSKPLLSCGAGEGDGDGDAGGDGEGDDGDDVTKEGDAPASRPSTAKPLISSITKKSFQQNSPVSGGDIHLYNYSNSSPNLHDDASQSSTLPAPRQPLLPKRVQSKRNSLHDGEPYYTANPFRRSRSLTNIEEQDDDAKRQSIRAWEEPEGGGDGFRGNPHGKSHGDHPSRASSQLTNVTSSNGSSRSALLGNVSIDSDMSLDLTDSSIDVGAMESQKPRNRGRTVDHMEVESISSRGASTATGRYTNRNGTVIGNNGEPLEPLMPAKLRHNKEKSANHTKEVESGEKDDRSPSSPGKPRTLGVKATESSGSSDEEFQTPSTESAPLPGFHEKVRSPVPSKRQPEQTRKKQFDAFFINPDDAQRPPSNVETQSFTLHRQSMTREAARAAGIPIIDDSQPFSSPPRGSSSSRVHHDGPDRELQKIQADHGEKESKNGMKDSFFLNPLADDDKQRPGSLDVAQFRLDSTATNPHVPSTDDRPSPKTSFAQIKKKKDSGEVSPIQITSKAPHKGVLKVGPSKSVKKTTFAALPNQTTWQESAKKTAQTSDSNQMSEDADHVEPLPSELIDLRMRLEEKRRQIETGKRQQEQKVNIERDKVGNDAFIKMIVKNKGAKDGKETEIQAPEPKPAKKPSGPSQPAPSAPCDIAQHTQQLNDRNNVANKQSLHRDVERSPHRDDSPHTRTPSRESSHERLHQVRSDSHERLRDVGREGSQERKQPKGRPESHERLRDGGREGSQERLPPHVRSDPHERLRDDRRDGSQERLQRDRGAQEPQEGIRESRQKSAIPDSAYSQQAIDREIRGSSHDRVVHERGRGHEQAGMRDIPHESSHERNISVPSERDRSVEKSHRDIDRTVRAGSNENLSDARIGSHGSSHRSGSGERDSDRTHKKSNSSDGGNDTDVQHEIDKVRNARSALANVEMRLRERCDSGDDRTRTRSMSHSQPAYPDPVEPLPQMSQSDHSELRKPTDTSSQLKPKAKTGDYSSSLDRLNCSLNELQGEIMKLSFQQDQIKSLVVEPKHPSPTSLSETSPPKSDPYYSMYPARTQGGEPDIGSMRAPAGYNPSGSIGNTMINNSSAMFVQNQAGLPYPGAPPHMYGMQQPPYVPQQPPYNPYVSGVQTSQGMPGYPMVQPPHQYSANPLYGGGVYPQPPLQQPGAGYPGQQWQSPHQMPYSNASGVPQHPSHMPVSTQHQPPYGAETHTVTSHQMSLQSPTSSPPEGTFHPTSAYSVSSQHPRSLPSPVDSSGRTPISSGVAVSSPLTIASQGNRQSPQAAGSPSSRSSYSPEKTAPEPAAPPAEERPSSPPEISADPVGFTIAFDSDSPRRQKPKLKDPSARKKKSKDTNGKQPPSASSVPDKPAARREPSPAATSSQQAAPGATPPPVVTTPGVGFVIGADPTELPAVELTDMEKKKQKILQQQMKRREEQEKKRLKLEQERLKKLEEKRVKEEQQEAKKAEDRSRRDAIYQNYLQRKAEQEAAEQDTKMPGAVSKRPKQKAKAPRPKSQPPPASWMHTGAQDDKNSLSSHSHSSQEDLSMKGGNHVPSNHTGATDRAGDDPDYTLAFGGVTHRRPPSPVKTFRQLCEYQDSLGLRSSKPDKPSGLPSPLKRKRASLGHSEFPVHHASQHPHHSASAEYLGPKLFVKPSQKSNRHIMINAISHCCLAGTVNDSLKNKVLEELARCDGKHFIILFRDAGQQYRAIYQYSPEHEEVLKISGTGPKQLTPKMFDHFYKYNSGAKNFAEITSTKHLSVSIDAVSIQNSYWQKKAPLLKRPGPNHY